LGLQAFRQAVIPGSRTVPVGASAEHAAPDRHTTIAPRIPGGRRETRQRGGAHVGAKTGQALAGNHYGVALPQSARMRTQACATYDNYGPRGDQHSVIRVRAARVGVPA
jgi:hypothetical protein